jgi:hypothetical protein
MSKKCECGKPAHPLYDGMCEDCFVDSTTSNTIGGIDQQLSRNNILTPFESPSEASGVDRHRLFSKHTDEEE